jgi:gluconate 2-dehydrogenase gamma chain
MDEGRRSFIASATGALAALAALDWTEVARAATHAHAAAVDPGAPDALTTLSVTQAACVAAIAARIVPTDDLPGASEAGVVYFIDRGLGSFFGASREEFIKGLAEFEARVAAAHPGTNGFAALPAAVQDTLLTGVQDTPFFNLMRFMTLCGLLASPAYGGNRDLVGWKLMGFEESHEFTPPFGHYDRDYPGFVPYPPAAAT